MTWASEDFGIWEGSWNQAPGDIKGQLYFCMHCLAQFGKFLKDLWHIFNPLCPCWFWCQGNIRCIKRNVWQREPLLSSPSSVVVEPLCTAGPLDAQNKSCIFQPPLQLCVTTWLSSDWWDKRPFLVCVLFVFHCICSGGSGSSLLWVGFLWLWPQEAPLWWLMGLCSGVSCCGARAPGLKASGSCVLRLLQRRFGSYRAWA